MRKEYLIIILLAICLLCSPALADETGTFGDNISWSLSDGTLTVSGTGAIPDASDYGATPWDEYKDQVETLVIENGITRIGNYAFWSFEQLTSVSFGSDVTQIGDVAFLYCPALTVLTFPEGMTSIGNWCFAKCEALTSVRLPVSITFIDEYAFFKCHLLTDIYYTGNQIQWAEINIVEIPEADWEDDPLHTAAVHFGTSTVTSGTCGEGVTWSLNDTGTLTVSGTGAMNDGADYGDMPWNEYKDQIIEIVVEDGITRVGDYAFWNCENAKTVYLGNGLRSIGKAAFLYCSGISRVTLPSGLMTIGDWAFVHCHDLEWVYIPTSVTSIGELCMEECTCTLLYGGTEQQWNNISISSDNEGLLGLNVIYGYTISTCNHRYVSEVIIPATCSEEGLKRYTCRICDEYTEGHTYTASIPKTRHHFGNGYCTNLLSDGTVCGASITTTKNYVYFTQPRYGLNLENPGSIDVRLLYTNLGVYGSESDIASRYTTYFAVTKLNSDGSVGELYAQTYRPRYLDFVNDFQLTTVNLPENGTYIFHVSTASGSNDIDQVTVTVGTPEVYEPSGDIGDLHWELEDGVLTISGTGEMCDFAGTTPWNRSAIQEIIIGEGVTTIGNGAFEESGNLTSISLPTSLTNIGAEAFFGCTKLGNFTIPQNVTSIGDFAFGHCDYLTEITVPMVSVGMFKGCERLEKVHISNGVTLIGDAAFLECQLLQEINLPAGITSIGNSAFENCISLEEIVLPATVTEIGTYAFCGCEWLKVIDLSSGIESIGEHAFGGSGLENVHYHGSAQDWRAMEIAEGNDELLHATREYEIMTVDFVLPNSVVSIEEEAFAGITDVVVQVPTGAQIADDAFDPSVVFAE